MKYCIFVILVSISVNSITVALSRDYSADENEIRIDAVCPPFFLKDESGRIINPVLNENPDEPYSPKQTCGSSGCHDYNKITRGYHFTQGAGEEPANSQSERLRWVTTPGNYGGSWCSPAPLYRYLSGKQNSSPEEMDMTSFSFITAGCGKCHPGGGPAEYDRNGHRYDQFMKDNNYRSGGENDFDGDYYKARWIETGVLEADCMICHQPGYDHAERTKQLQALNFRWAPTVASGFATVSGSIQENEQVNVTYNTSLFDEEGKISPHIVREPRDKACLECHAQPGWKKRGANFSARTDVHIRAGLKCVDCHPAGSRALDSRINEREMHQIGKGDDPGGQVRNDLDNTVLDCVYCHSKGHLGAPIAKHTWLPPVHLEKIACQTCHIPVRNVKPAQFQAGDVFNPGTKIPSKGKHLWTFYGPDMQYYNHYGNMGMMGFDDKPTDSFIPVYAKYKGKIYPVNRVHSAWPAIEIEGEPGLMQPKMSDIYKMWMTHFKSPDKYPALSLIKDDNGDGVIEVNRGEEIEALIASVTSMFEDINYPMEGKRIVWTMNDRIYRSGTDFRTINKEEWEASPFGNVHKYNHDVYPANSALGIKGCTECHDTASRFFTETITYPFDENGQTVTTSQHTLIGINKSFLVLGAIREKYVKPLLYVLLLMTGCVLIGQAYVKLSENNVDMLPGFMRHKWMPLVISGLTLAGFLAIIAQPQLRQYALPARFWLDANHFFLSAAIISGTFLYSLQQNRKVFRLIVIFIIIAVISGLTMLLRVNLFDFLTSMSYSLFDISIVFIIAIVVFHLIWKLKDQFRQTT